MAIFLAPLYLVWAWHRKPELRHLLRSIGLASLIPFVVSIPFMIANFEKFFKSILFSATRGSATHMRVKNLGDYFGMQGLDGKIPLLVMLIFVFFLAFKRIIGPYTSAFLVMTVFMTFNSVLMNQYLVWTAFLLPLIFLDIKRRELSVR